MIDDLVERVHRLAIEGAVDSDDIAGLVAREGPLVSATDRAEIARRTVARMRGLGPIDHLLGDADVSEVMINGPGPVYVERSGTLEGAGFDLDSAELTLLVERIVAPLGRHLDPLRPWIDGRLADGSRVSIVGLPVAVDGPYVTIRRFVLDRPVLAAFAEPEVVARLDREVDRGSTIIVSGGTGAGKTSLLNALASRLPTVTRVVTVEDAAELALPLPHVVRLECRPPGIEGGGQVGVRELVRAALRMRPDRLILGEVRGAEAFDLMQALNTGHGGSMSTVHANSPADAMRRLETLILSAGTGTPAAVVRAQLASAIDLIVQVARTDGRRREIVALAEVADDGSVATDWTGNR